jgi:hypothetical protein
VDQIPLVEQQIADGKRFVERLLQEGFPVTAACWVKESDGRRWYLYLISPFVDARGALEAYRRILPVAQQMPQPFEVNPLEIKAIETKEPVGKAVIRLHKRYGGRHPSRFPEPLLGDRAVDGVYLYPPIAPPAPEETGAAKQTK